MLSLTLLGTNGGPLPLATRFGISSALVVNGKTYVVDCGRGAVSQYLRAGLSMPSLAAIFLTHLHADHTVDYFSFPLLAGGASGPRGFPEPITVYGPGPSGHESLVSDGPVPRTVERTANMTTLARRADILVHEAAAFDVLPELGLKPALLNHIRAVHTDVADLGEIAAEAEVGSLVVNHLSPGVLADEQWQELIDRSRKHAGFGGDMYLGMDLMTISVSDKGK